jgi:hypothetical protein
MSVKERKILKEREVTRENENNRKKRGTKENVCVREIERDKERKTDS